MALINDFLSLIFPRHCEACGNNLFKHETAICNYCKLNLPKTNYHESTSNALLDVFAGRVPLVNALCFYKFEKSGKVQKLLHAIKYQNQKELAQIIGTMYAEDLIKRDYLKDVDLMIPIPLHKNKLKQRGFNQSEWFAKGLSMDLKIPIDSGILQRNVETSTQTKKRKYQRWENVDGIFSLTKKNEIEHKHVLLVDDVVTTGATIEAAWQALREVEGIKISVISIAFATQKV